MSATPATDERGPGDLARVFEEQGYLVLERLVSDEALVHLRAAYDEILARDVDCASDDRWLGELTRQIEFPSRYHETFARNEALDRAREIASAIAGPGCRAEHVYDQLLFKPPGHAAETPWHQDLSYLEMPFAPAGRRIRNARALQFWLALDDADEANGCMHFLSGPHREPLLPHRVASGDPERPNRLLAIDRPEAHLDLSRAVACPLRAGGATLHGYLTPHYTGPNRTADRPRRAYILTFLVQRNPTSTEEPTA